VNHEATSRNLASKIQHNYRIVLYWMELTKEGGHIKNGWTI